MLAAGVSMTGQRVASVLARLWLQRPVPKIITPDNGSEFYSQAMDSWAYRHGVQLEFIRPGKLVDNAFIESFNGRLRDECLNAHLFLSIQDARRALEAWRIDYNHQRPHKLRGLTELLRSSPGAGSGGLRKHRVSTSDWARYLGQVIARRTHTPDDCSNASVAAAGSASSPRGGVGRHEASMPGCHSDS